MILNAAVASDATKNKNLQEYPGTGPLYLSSYAGIVVFANVYPSHLRAQISFRAQKLPPFVVSSGRSLIVGLFLESQRQGIHVKTTILSLSGPGSPSFLHLESPLRFRYICFALASPSFFAASNSHCLFLPVLFRLFLNCPKL